MIEENSVTIESLRQRGIEVIPGLAEQEILLDAANVAAARWVFVAVPNAFEAGQYVRWARAANPAVSIIARADTDAECEHLQSLGANVTILGARETAQAMVAYALDRQGAPIPA